jgi:hypothetical protein
MLSSLVLAKLATVLTEPMMEHRGATFTVERIHITDGRTRLEGEAPALGINRASVRRVL